MKKLILSSLTIAVMSSMIVSCTKENSATSTSTSNSTNPKASRSAVCDHYALGPKGEYYIYKTGTAFYTPVDANNLYVHDAITGMNLYTTGISGMPNTQKRFALCKVPNGPILSPTPYVADDWAIWKFTDANSSDVELVCVLKVNQKHEYSDIEMFDDDNIYLLDRTDNLLLTVAIDGHVINSVDFSQLNHQVAFDGLALHNKGKVILLGQIKNDSYLWQIDPTTGATQMSQCDASFQNACLTPVPTPAGVNNPYAVNDECGTFYNLCADDFVVCGTSFSGNNSFGTPWTVTRPFGLGYIAPNWTMTSNVSIIDMGITYN
jgi:hypothetical protein